jgi:hypothetical protein
MLTGRTAQDDGDASASASSIFFSSSIVLGAWSLSLGYYDIMVMVEVAVGSRPMALVVWGVWCCVLRWCS